MSERMTIQELAEAARQQGYGDTARIINHLQRLIERNQDYLAYREGKGRSGAYNEVVARDTIILALVIEILQGKKEEKKP